MAKTIKAIPTEYNGIQMRSRLEARWAMFFGKLGWKWTYEPIECDGWIPDFLLEGRMGHILVDVKPELITRLQWSKTPDEETTRKMNSHMWWDFESSDIRAKIDAAFPLPCDGVTITQLLRRFPIVLAAEPTAESTEIAIGYIRVITGQWVPARLCQWPPQYHCLTHRATAYGIYTGCVDVFNGLFRPDLRSHIEEEEVAVVMDLWKECKNHTQWKGKQSVC